MKTAPDAGSGAASVNLLLRQAAVHGVRVAVHADGAVRAHTDGTGVGCRRDCRDGKGTDDGRRDGEATLHSVSPFTGETGRHALSPRG